MRIHLLKNPLVRPRPRQTWYEVKLNVIELQKPFDLYCLEIFLIYLPIKNANFKWFKRITEELKLELK